MQRSAHTSLRMGRIFCPIRRSPTQNLTLQGLLLCFLLTGCGRQTPKEQTPVVEAEPAPLARVGTAIISEEDFDLEVQRRVEARRPLVSPEAVLNEMVEREAMLQEAKRSPWLDEPAARRARETLLLSQWLDQALHAEKNRLTVSDDEMRKAYDENLAAFTRPAMVRLAILYRKPSEHGAEDSAEALTLALEKARQQYLDDPSAATRSGRIPGFGAIAAEASEDTVSRYRGGDLGWLDASRTDYRWPQSVVEAGLALSVGGVSGVMAEDSGLYVVMKQDRREASVTPFEEAAVMLRRRMLKEKQESFDRSFRNRVLEQVDVQINAERVATLSLPVIAPPLSPPSLRPVADWANGP